MVYKIHIIMKKIYIEDININNNINNTINIKKIIEKITSISNSYRSYIQEYLYSKSGIYIIEYNSLYKIERKDFTLEKMTLNNKKIIIDKSKDIRCKNIYQIPFEHKIHKIFINEYKLDNISKLTFVIERKLNNFENDYNSDANIINYYFTIPETENITNYIEEKIDTYISVFN